MPIKLDTVLKVLIYITNTTLIKLPIHKIKKIIALVFEKENVEIFNISVVFCGDRRIKTLNKKYLNHNYPTDTISFEMNSSHKIAGEFYISLHTVQRNANHYGLSFLNELSRVTIHACLHLIGYTDKKKPDKEKMRIKENKYMKTLGFENK